MKIAVALRLLRARQGLTQTAAAQLEGAPDYRTLSHWETGRKTPSLPLLKAYLEILGLDFIDLQEALDQADGKPQTRVRRELVEHRELLTDHDERLARLERPRSPVRPSDG